MAQLGRIQLADSSLGTTSRDASRFSLRVAGIDVPLPHGETLIGRSDDCHVRINDGLVSRHHARIVVEGDDAFIEDLGSANGIFVNQERVEGRTRLSPNDRLFVGTVELCVEEAVWDDDRPTDSGIEPVGDVLDRPTPVAEVEVSPPALGQTLRAKTGEPIEDATTTVGAFEYLGRLADKMFTMGRVDAAERILGSHLEELVEAARQGEELDPKLVDTAGKYSVKLATETLEGRWIDLAIELHTHRARPLRADTLQHLASLHAKAPLGQRDLLDRYVRVLRARLDAYSVPERVLIERIACLKSDDEPER